MQEKDDHGAGLRDRKAQRDAESCRFEQGEPRGKSRREKAKHAGDEADGQSGRDELEAREEGAFTGHRADDERGQGETRQRRGEPSDRQRALGTKPAGRREGAYVSLTLSPTRVTSRTAVKTLITIHEGSNSERRTLNFGLDG